MYRKAIQTLAVTMVLSVVAITGELTALASVRPSTPPLLQATGALPQAPGDPFRPAGDTALLTDDHSRLVRCKSLAEWNWPAGRASASQVTQPKVSLGQLTILGQALARGEYTNGTAPTGFESALTGVELPIRSKIPTLILAAIMLLVLAMVARHGDPVAEVALSVHGAPRISASPSTAPRSAKWPQFGLRNIGFVDLAADWERVLLVPT